MQKTYMQQIKEAAHELGYDVSTPYFDDDMEDMWGEYEEAGTEPGQAVVMELGE